MEAASAVFRRRLVDDHPDLVELEGIGVRGLEERVTTRGLLALDDAVVVAGRRDARDVDGLEEAARAGAKAFLLVEAGIDEQILLLDNGRLSRRELVGGRLETILHLRHSLLHEHELLLDLVGGSHAGREHDTRDSRNDGDQIGTHLETLLLGCRTLHSNLARSRKSGSPSGVEGIVWGEGPRDSVPEGAEQFCCGRFRPAFEEQVSCRVESTRRSDESVFCACDTVSAVCTPASCARSNAIACASARHMRRSRRTAPIITCPFERASAECGRSSFTSWWDSKGKRATCSDGGVVCIRFLDSVRRAAGIRVSGWGSVRL